MARELIIDNARAILGALQPLMGPPATGTLTVTASGADATLPKRAVAIPLRGDTWDEQGAVFITANPDDEECGGWPVTGAGAAVTVESLLGGERVNFEAGQQYRFHPPIPGIEEVATAATAIDGGAYLTGFAVLRQACRFKLISKAELDELFRARVSDSPAVVLSWIGSEPKDGPLESTTGPRTARMGASGKLLFRNRWRLLIVTSRVDTELERRGDGEGLVGHVMQELTEAMKRRDLVISNSPGIEISACRPFGANATAFVDELLFSTGFTLKKTERRTFNLWKQSHEVYERTPTPEDADPINQPDILDVHVP